MEEEEIEGGSKRGGQRQDWGKEMRRGGLEGLGRKTADTTHEGKSVRVKPRDNRGYGEGSTYREIASISNVMSLSLPGENSGANRIRYTNTLMGGKKNW